MRKPELLAPAGNPERLEMALAYGADAVYVGGPEFGLRASAGSFDAAAMAQAAARCHGLGRKLYVTMNIFARQEDLGPMAAYAQFLQGAGADGVLVSDPGALRRIQRAAPALPIFLSTQANTLNADACAFWLEQGVRRIVLARELSYEQIVRIRELTPPGLELEVFVHGAMCMAYSGRCLLSLATTGREANRGACAQPCRGVVRGGPPRDELAHELAVEQDDQGSYLLSAKELCMYDHLDRLLALGLDSLKIEGRMKSLHYVATVVNAYRMGIDAAAAGRPLPALGRRELMAIKHRPYDTGFYFGQPGQVDLRAPETPEAKVAAIVRGCDEGGAWVEQRFPFARGNRLSVLSPGRTPWCFTAERMEDDQGRPIDRAPHPQMRVRLHPPRPLRPWDILRLNP